MHQLPAELLIDIFIYCAHNDVCSPLTLGQVCRQWRGILQHTPVIYQLIILNDRHQSLLRANQISNIYLERTRSLPFDVHADVHSGDDLLPILSPFLAHLDRWRSCRLGGAPFRFDDLWPSSRGERRLEGLDINVLDIGEIDENVEQASVADPDAPSHPPSCLYKFAFTGDSLSVYLTAARLPQSVASTPMRFASLVISEGTPSVSLGPRELLDFLSTCPEIEFFSFTGSMCEPELSLEDGENPPPIVELLQLRTLILHSTLCTRIILSAIHTPALEELCLEHLNVDFKFPIHNPFLPRQLPPPPGATSPDTHPSYGIPVTQLIPMDTDTPSSAPVTYLFPPDPLPFAEDYTPEDGDSDEEGDSDYSQSPYSDHATGMGIRSLVRRSRPPLRVLEMDYADMRTKDFAWLFARVPLLSEFRIVASDMSDRVIRMLGVWTDPYCIGNPGICDAADAAARTGAQPQCAHYVMLPHLAVLELIHCQRLSGAAIVEAVKGRAAVTDTASRVRLAEPLPLSEVAIVGCVQFRETHEEEVSEVLGDRLRTQ
ncbi:hypothetical protein FA95DRAFT_386527 [Auriscalpium vulgare]|uniref:Uncharacterized protein n=1 Tax=Auriscalpium vulgare TaxID=40419 RepID=A0ACB8S4R7_9AGAM|nr:hypothetical protein FA95DRAFT_386527 [Auriscalpium vulgare]